MQIHVQLVIALLRTIQFINVSPERAPLMCIVALHVTRGADKP